MRKHYPEPAELDMNCIPGTGIRFVSTMFLVMLVSCAAAQSTNEGIYGADYTITPVVSRAGAYVELRVAQNEPLLRELSMAHDTDVISEIEGDGELSIDALRIRWRPAADGGRLRWFAKINHLRDKQSYDAFIGEEWALFRAEDVIPATASRTLRGASSKTRLMFELPDGWSAVSEYFQRAGVHDVSNPRRRFDKPAGWIVLGHLGVRNETIAGVRVIAAAPVGHSVRRMDMLAMFNWTLPDLLRVLPEFPRRLTVVSAGKPMWRGALSAPGSFYVHADRPLISENGTSTILHEAMHIGMGADAVEGADWIIEGLAEYYSLEILRRSATINEKRYRSARSRLESWGKEARSLCVHRSTGAVTGRAVGLLARLNDEIVKRSERTYDLDNVVRSIAESQDKISVQQLQLIAEKLIGGVSEVLSDKSLNNCEN